jgi:hypothetical protein
MYSSNMAIVLEFEYNVLEISNSKFVSPHSGPREMPKMQVELYKTNKKVVNAKIQVEGRKGGEGREEERREEDKREEEGREEK